MHQGCSQLDVRPSRLVTVGDRSLWTLAQRSLSEVHVMFCECYFFNFYGRFMLRPRLTEVRETFTRRGPWVWIDKLLLGFFLVRLKLQVGQKSDEIWHIFRPGPQTICSHARTRQNIVILKKNYGCSTRVPRLVNFGIQTPEIHAS